MTIKLPEEGGLITPISSIFSNVKIRNPEKAEILINELDLSINKPEDKMPVPDISHMTDKDEIRKFMSKRFPDA